MSEPSRYEQGRYIIVENNDAVPLDQRIQLALLEALRKWVMRMFNRDEATEAILGALAGYFEVSLKRRGVPPLEGYTRMPGPPVLRPDWSIERAIMDRTRDVLTQLHRGNINIKEAELDIRRYAVSMVNARVSNEQKLDCDGPVPGPGGDGGGDGGPSGGA